MVLPIRKSKNSDEFFFSQPFTAGTVVSPIGGGIPGGECPPDPLCLSISHQPSERISKQGECPHQQKAMRARENPDSIFAKRRQEDAVFAVPQWRGINRHISEESLITLFSSSFVTQRGLIGEKFIRILRLQPKVVEMIFSGKIFDSGGVNQNHEDKNL
jgi:hypothetical protein